jgi:hypothetical protein
LSRISDVSSAFRSSGIPMDLAVLGEVNLSTRD